MQSLSTPSIERLPIALSLWALLGILAAPAALAQPAPPAFEKSFAPATIGVDSASALTFVITASDEVTDLAFTDTLPAGLTFADPASPTLGPGCDPGSTVSAPDGGTTLSFTSPRLGAGAECTVRVDVVGSGAGTFTNNSGDLTSSAGNSGNATAELVLTTARPSITKQFSPDATVPGGTVRLEFFLDNTSGSPVSGISFSDDLPSGLVVATPPRATSTCSGAFTAEAGSTSVRFILGTLSAGASCELGVDVTTDIAGTFANRTSVADSSAGELGLAVDELASIVDPVSLIKRFEDPVAPGGTVELVFTLRNTTRSPVSGIAFTDDLAATLTGLQTTGGLPLAPCGGSLSGGSTIGFSGGSLDSGEVCSFSVDLLVPAGADLGSYPNTTSDVTSSAGTFSPARDDLDVFYTPLLTKELSVEQVEGGEMITATFTIENPDPDHSVSGLQFQDDFAAFLNGTTVSPDSQTGVCGGGSVFFDLDGSSSNELYALTSGSLPAGGSCSFSVDLQLPTNIPDGVHVNRTTPIVGTYTIGETDVIVVGNAGEDQVTRSFAPELSKTFLDPVAAGDTVDLVFTLDASESPVGFTGISFTDELEATLSGLSAVTLPLVPCGAGSTISGTSTLSLSGASLAAGDSCTFTVTLQVPAGAEPGSYSNTTSEVSATADGQPVVGAAATDILDLDRVSFTKAFVDDPAVPGNTVTLAFVIQNLSDDPLSDISFSDDLDAVLAGLAPTDVPQTGVCGTGSTLSFAAGTLLLAGGDLAAGSDCTFSTVLEVPTSAAPGEYANTTSNLLYTAGTTPLLAPAASDRLLIDLPLSLSKSFTDDPVGTGGTATLSFTLANTSPTQTATDLEFTDDLDATLAGLEAIVLPMGEVCGFGSAVGGTSLLSFTGGSLAPQSSCTFEVVLSVPDGVSGTFVNETSDLSATLGGNAVTVPGGSDELTVTAARLTKAFSGDAAAGGTVDLTFTLENLASAGTLTGLAFTDDLGSVIAGLAATGTPLADPCGTGSSLTGTSVLELSGATLPPESDCVFTVTLAVPADAAPGTYTNTTGPLRAGTSEIAPGASADLAVQPPPGFAKAFAPAVIPLTGISTLTFTVDNGASSLAAGSLAFADDLPAGVTVATTPNAASTCGGTVNAPSGGASIALSGGSVAAGATCTVAVDVTSSVAGSYDNVSGELTSSLGASGTASDTLEVVGGELAVSKAFDDPVLRGGEVELAFTVATGASFGVSGVAFTDDLGAVLPGLAAVSLPADGFCGAGSQVTGTTVLSVSGVSVAAGSSCSFGVVLSVPADAALGTYTNTTSAATGVREGGLETTADPATAPLQVVFVDFTKQFLDDEVTAGDSTILRFTLSNPDPSTAITGLTFTDDLDAALLGARAVGLPMADVCGAGSILSGAAEITLTNGSLAAGASCSFDVEVDTVRSTPSGPAINRTGPLAGRVGGDAVSGDATDVAQDSIVVSEPAPILEIPTLGFWGLVLLVTSLGLFGALRLRW